MDPIVNRVAQSPLVVIDLEELYPEGRRILLDVKPWLHEGLILREKEFRDRLLAINWSDYLDCYVALYCSADTIIPGWAYPLVSSHLVPYVRKTIVGDLEQLETAIFQDIISEIDFAYLKDKPVIIKGCTHKPIPASAYLFLLKKIQPLAKSIMYGEACSAVPLYKRNSKG